MQRGKLAHILSSCFAVSDEESLNWFKRLGEENVRVALRLGEVQGGMVLLPMFQYFGGRPIPMMGVAGVGVSPCYRRQGLAKKMMKQALLEAHERGFALSSLYASSLALYRHSGYELAGGRYKVQIPAELIKVKGDTSRIQELEEADFEAVKEVHQRFAEAGNGQLGRPEALWRRARFERDGRPLFGYGYRTAKGLEGYLYLRTERQPGEMHHLLKLTDFIALNEAAARGLWALLSNHATTASNVHCFLSPWSLPPMVLEERQALKTRLLDTWTLRILNIPLALESRGYPKAVSGRVSLRIKDKQLFQNNRAWVLDVDRGVAQVKVDAELPSRLRSSHPVFLGPRGLSALFSGHMNPFQLKALGFLDGEDRDLLTLQLLFGGPQPWMIDMF